jgi:NAD(P)-dependent dehydrogenase (short-subunit alcohol dehydrogenase family)
MLPGIRLFDLTGRVAVVTGGSKGLGYAMAAGLASAGADVALVSRHLDEAKSASEQIATAFGTRAIGVRADVAVEADTVAMVDRVLRELGRIDVLVNSAGINRRGPIDKLGVED